MKSRTGHHHARRTAAKVEPSPITALRDMLATAFAADIAAVTPVACDVVRAAIPATASPARRHRVMSAHDALIDHPGVLAMGVAQEFRKGFDRSMLAAVNSSAKSHRLSAGPLALMDEGRLAVDLAADQCIARLKEQAGAEVFQLTARVASMLEKPYLDESMNPVGPRILVIALVEALENMGLGNEERLAVFQAFGPPLLHIAPDLYGHANGLLVERGILAEFNARYGRPTLARPVHASHPDPAMADERTLAAILERLLNGGRASNVGAGQLAGAAL